MREITLADGHRAALVDDGDYDRLRSLPWYYSRGYAILTIGTRPTRTTESMHRRILDPGPDMEVDHVNGNGLDNRRANLRAVTRNQNMRNTAASGLTSGFKGVSRTRGEQSFRVRIMVDGRRVYLGRFADEVAAALAYDDAARRLHGRYGSYNFPRAGERPALRPNRVALHEGHQPLEALAS